MPPVFQLILPFQLDLPFEGGMPASPMGRSAGKSRETVARAAPRRAAAKPKRAVSTPLAFAGSTHAGLPLWERDV